MTMEQVGQDGRASWRLLFNIGGIAALLAVFVFRRNMGAELMMLRGLFPAVPAALPVDAAGWFALLHQHPFVGLTLLEAFDLVEYALIGVVFLSVGVALWKANRSAMLMATVLGWAGIIAYFASNQAFALLALSGRYAAAVSDIQRTSPLAAGEALLSINNPGALFQGTGIFICMFLVPLAGLIMSLVMLHSPIFNKATAMTGILANGLILCYFPVMAFIPSMLVLPFVLSAPLRVTWYFLLALRFFKLGKEAGTI